jgi:hypothetical protein
MKILAIEKEVEGIDSKLFSLYARNEALKVYEYYQKGVIREIYFRKDKSEAILILECNDEIEAENFINTLPFVENGLIDFEIIPLQPYPGFERLFVQQK